MLECVECNTKLDILNLEQGAIIDCPGCGTEMEFLGDILLGLHLGPSEE